MEEQIKYNWTTEELQKFLEGETIQERTNSYCGKRFVKGMVEGVISIGVHRCHQHRTCEFCYGIRRDEFKQRLINEDNPNDLVAIVCPNEVAEKFLRNRKVDSAGYLRSPLEDGENVIIAVSKEVADSVKSFKYDKWTRIVDEGGNIDQTVLDAFANLPFGKRTSGNLGKKEKKQDVEPEYPQPEDENDYFEARVPRYLVDTTNDVDISRIYYEAIVESSYLKPENENDLHELSDARDKAYQRLLRVNGIDNMVVRYSFKVVSLKWMLNNFVTISEEVPDVKITVNSNIGEIISPIARTFKDILGCKLGEEAVKNIKTA